jgi:hypothetical protein
MQVNSLTKEMEVIMKRFVTIFLVTLLLSTNYAYATLSIEEVSPAIKAALAEKQLQENIEELFAEIVISFMEGNGFAELSSSVNLAAGDIQPSQEFSGNPLYDLILLLSYGVYFIVQLAGSLINGIVYAVTWVVQVVFSIFQNFPDFLVNLVSFIANLIFGVLEIFLGGSSNLLIYLLPLIITIISIIIDDIDIEI